jgi:2-keto-4-pentenoate hydratase
VQDATMLALGPVGGWKVGSPDSDGRISCAPIPAALIFASPASIAVSVAPVAEVEVEVALKLACDLPPQGKGPDLSQVRRAVASVHVALEVLSSRFANRTQVDAIWPLADLQSNAAVVLGPSFGDHGMLCFETLESTLWIDGKLVEASRRGPAGVTILQRLASLADHAAGRTDGLKAGQVIMTGARIGPVRFNTGSAVEAQLASERASLTIVG